MEPIEMSDSLKPANNRKSRLLLMMCQFRPTPSNPLLNAIEIVKRMKKARSKGARLIVFGECALQGYSIYDELKNPDFYRQSAEALDIVKYASESLKIGVILGYYRINEKKSEKWANNSLYCHIPPGISQLSPLDYQQDKVLIPFEKELNEILYVQEGELEKIKIINFGQWKVGFNICQDSWQALSQIRRFKNNPVEQVLNQKPDIFINISCSPFYLGKTDDMIYNVLSKISRDHQIPVLYLGIVGLDGGQLLLGGYSQVIYNGEIYKHLKLFEEDEHLIDLNRLHELPLKRKALTVFSSEAQRRKRHFQSVHKAFQSVFHYLGLKHNISDQDVTIDDPGYQSCFKDTNSIRGYLEIMEQDKELYAKKGFVFLFDGSPASILLAKLLSFVPVPTVNKCAIITEDSPLTDSQRKFLKTCNLEIHETTQHVLIDTVNQFTHNQKLLALDTFCFTDYMLGKIPRLVFGLAPLGSLSYSLIYELLSDYGLLGHTALDRQYADDQLVVDIVLQSFLRDGKDFKSVLLKSFPVYFEYMSRFGEVSSIAESFLEYLLNLYKRYHNAMNHVSIRINPSSIIQLTWYSPNRYKYVNHSLSVSDWYIRKAFEEIRPQLENW